MLLSKYTSSKVNSELACAEYIVAGKNKIIQALRIPTDNKLRVQLLKWANDDAFKAKEWFKDWINNESKIGSEKKNGLVKKTVRIDTAMYKHCKKAKNNRLLSYCANKVIMQQITKNEIDLIGSRKFDYRITIYFTKEQYKAIKRVLNELNSRKLDVTFSSLVRSILYKKMKLVLPIEEVFKN